MVEPGLLDPECSMLTTLCLPQFYHNDLTKESSFEWQLSPILYSGWILWLDFWKSWLYSMQLWPGWLVQCILFLIWPMLLPTKILWWQMRCDWFRILCAKCRFHDIPSWGCHACDCKYFYFFCMHQKLVPLLLIFATVDSISTCLWLLNITKTIHRLLSEYSSITQVGWEGQHIPEEALF